MPVPLIAAGVASLIARAAVSTAAKKALTQAAAKGLTKRQVAELIVRNETTAAKTLANKGIKTGPKRYEYRGTGRSDPKLDAAFRGSPEEGSVQAMAKRMLEQSPEKAARIAEGKAKVVMARNRAQTVARVAKKKELTTSTPKVKRVRTTKPTRTGSAEEAALVARRVRPPEGYSGAKVIKPIKRATKPVDTSTKVTKPATKKTPQEIKEAKQAARERRIAANARGKITGKDSVTKAPAKTTRTELKEQPRTQREMRLKRNAQEEKIRIERLRQAGKKESKGRAERQRDVDDQEVPQGQTIRGRFYPESTVGIPARSTRTGNTIAERSPKVREDLPPKDELTAIKKAFAELTKEEKALMRIADERGIQGILREKIAQGSNRKPAGPKDAPIRKRLTPDERLAILKRQVRAKRKQNDTIEQRIAVARKKLTPAQRKAIAEAVARAKRNSK